MRILITLLLLTSLTGGDDPKKKGREGNIQYRAEAFDLAAAAYRDGIQSIQESGPGTIHSGLLNNLGATLDRQDDYQQAAASFSSAARMAPGPEDRVRASYNAGNALTKAEELESALEMYRMAMLEDPSNLDAKFNYEYVRRKLQEDQQQQDQQSQDQQDDEQQQESDGQGDDSEEQEQNQDEQQQQEQDQAGDESQQQDQEQQQDQQQQQQQDPTELSPEEAQRILEALENEEEQLLRQVQKLKTRPRRVEKDW